MTHNLSSIYYPYNNLINFSTQLYLFNCHFHKSLLFYAVNFQYMAMKNFEGTDVTDLDGLKVILKGDSLPIALISPRLGRHHIPGLTHTQSSYVQFLEIILLNNI